jgi:hypothetical protein
MKLNKAQQALLLMLVILSLAGCTSSKIIAKQELIKAQHQQSSTLSKLSVGIIPKQGAPNHYQLERFVNDLNRAQLFKRAEIASPTDTWPDVLISNVEDNYPMVDLNQGFMCFEPYLLVITVGVIPSACKTTHTLSFEMSLPKSKTSLKVKENYVHKTALGWIAKLLTPSEKGKFNGTDAEYLRALFTYYTPQIEKLLSSSSQHAQGLSGSDQAN